MGWQQWPDWVAALTAEWVAAMAGMRKGRRHRAKPRSRPELAYRVRRAAHGRHRKGLCTPEESDNPLAHEPLAMFLKDFRFWPLRHPFFRLAIRIPKEALSLGGGFLNFGIGRRAACRWRLNPGTAEKWQALCLRAYHRSHGVSYGVGATHDQGLCRASAGPSAGRRWPAL